MNIGNSKKWKKYNTEKVQHDQSIVTEWNLKKNVQEECTRMHKRMMGRPLTNRFFLEYLLLFLNDNVDEESE